MSGKQPKFIFVTGGVLSGVGKGITAASIGNILKARGLSVNIQKCDPYLNVDAGTLNPGEHGECFVTVDGAETDLDLGHYERFMDIELKRTSAVISGSVMSEVIADERAGKYLGKTVQIIPHVTNVIIERIKKAAEGFDVHIVEIGGTVGDYEGLSFVEAIRELSVQVGRDNAAFVHVVYLPFLGASKELKTKPAQNAVRDLRGLGIVPDVLVARSEEDAETDVVEKLSLFSGVPKEAVISLPNADTIYEVPLTLQRRGIGQVLADRLALETPTADLKQWEQFVATAKSANLPVVKVGVVAKYLNNEDTYMSVFEALKSAGWGNGVQVAIEWIDAEEITKANVADMLKNVDGIVVPGGFGERGVEGMVIAAAYAMDEKLPYLGICLGLQVAVIAAARRAGVSAANSTEFDPNTKEPVISTMEDQKGKEATGGTMRLGDYATFVQKGTLAESVYKDKLENPNNFSRVGGELGLSELQANTAGVVWERHRHRYECNNDYRDRYESWGIRVAGLSPDGSLVEMIDAPDHPFFLAAQSHPEFDSRPGKPWPFFNGFIASLK